MKLEPPRKGVPRLKPKPDISPIIDDPTNTCRSCNYQFVNRLKYRSHLARAHKIKLEPLHKTAPKLQPQPNVAPVIDDSNNYCRSCKYQFSGKRSYRLHLMRIHKMKLKPLRKSVPQLKPQTDLSPVPDDPSNTCRSCNHQFSSKTAYRRHLKYIHKMKLEPLEKSIPKLKSQPNIIPVADDPNHTADLVTINFQAKIPTDRI
jgi:transposase-like protein